MAGLALAGPAVAVQVSVSVQNAAAPRVWFVSPKDGDRLPAGEEVVVRAESENGEKLSMIVEGTTVWSVAGDDAIQGAWAPDVGRHRLVAVAERPGAPDGVAAIEVFGVEPSAAAPGAPPAAPADPVTPSTPGPGAVPEAPGGPLSTTPGGGTFRPSPAGSPQTTPVAPSGRPTIAADRDPSAGAGGTGGGDGDGGGGGGWRAWLSRILHDPEKLAWGVALPLLLIAAGAGYLLLQRFIDGGQKLAWRGRGRPHDTIVEF